MLNHPPEDYAKTFDSEHRHSCPDSVSTCLFVITLVYVDWSLCHTKADNNIVTSDVHQSSLVSMHVNGVNLSATQFSSILWYIHT